MRRKPAFVLLLVHLTIVGLLVSSVYPAVATTYSPGVKAGDFVKYGTVSASFSSNVSGTPTPQSIKDLQATSSVRLDVQSVSGNNVTEKVTESFSNGTADKTQFFVWTVQTFQANASSSNFFSVSSLPLAAGGLTTNDKICTGTNSQCNGSFNQTVSRTYAGAARSVNALTITMSSGGNSISISGYWDQSTGVLDELSASFSFTSPGSPANKETAALDVANTQTSLWSATIFGLSPLIFYGIIGAIAAIVVIVAAVMLMKRRKPPVPPSPATTGTPPPGP
jgi:hypothetical protein